MDDSIEVLLGQLSVIVVLHGFSVSSDDGHRGSEFVGHVGDEILTDSFESSEFGDILDREIDTVVGFGD